MRPVAWVQVEIKLLPTVMAFITMNPGYPGRAELPESLKALFRPVSMVLPDLALICEIMLMAEGFQMSKLLSRKFVILYKLCEDLLSKVRAPVHTRALHLLALVISPELLPNPSASALVATADGRACSSDKS